MHFLTARNPLTWLILQVTLLVAALYGHLFSTQELRLSMSAFFFGHSSKPLFGYYHAPAPGLDRSIAVLICPPLGQEYLRAHRSLVQVSHILARNHLHVMRFDYSGTGDSWGDLQGVSVQDWLEDVSLAAKKLAELSSASSVLLFGIRFGATLISCLKELPAQATGRIYWDPVLQGGDYLHKMRQIQNQRIADSNLFAVDRRTILPPHENDLLGFQWSDALLAELAETQLDQSELPSHVLLSKDFDQPQALQSMGLKDHALIPMNHPSHWHDSHYLEKQVVQPQLAQMLANLV